MKKINLINLKKINSVNYGGKIILIGLILISVPMILYNFVQISFINLLLKISICLGSLILLSFFILLGVELKQDKELIKYYGNNKNTPVKIGEFYECQNCGSRRVKPTDKKCSVCGIKFKIK